VLFFLPAVVTVIGLAIGRAETTVVGIFLLATVACAALLPPVSQLTQQQLVVLQVAVGVGIIGIYPVAIALARAAEPERAAKQLIRSRTRNAKHRHGKRAGA
jgi:MFS family permease